MVSTVTNGIACLRKGNRRRRPKYPELAERGHFALSFAKTTKKSTENYDGSPQPLLCSLNPLFGGVLAVFAAVVALGLWYCQLIWKKESWKQLCNCTDCRGGMQAIKVYVVIVFVQKHQTQTPQGIWHHRRAQSSKTSNPQKPYRCLIAIFFLIKTSRYTSAQKIFFFSKLSPYHVMHFNFILKSSFAVFCPIAPNACNLIF